MKKAITCILLLAAAGSYAQTRPQYTQYILNNYIINPALAGIENYTDVKVSHRHQWVGIDDAPVTSYITIQGSIGKEDRKANVDSYSPPGQNPRGKEYWRDYESAKPHHGIGLQVINDKTGPLKRFSAYGTYAYHIGISQQTSFAAGINLGITNNTLDASKLVFDNPVDPAVAGSNAINKLRPDVNVGVWLYSANYFAGLSALQIIPQGLEFSNDTLKVARKSYPHIFLTGGYKFLAGDDMTIIPSVVIRYVDPLPIGVDINVKCQFQDRLWFGGGFRINSGFSGMVGINVSSLFSVGYAYDYTTSKLQSYTKGTHEFVVGFLLGNKWGGLCPRNLW